MTPFEFEDFRPPNKRPPSPMGFKDYAMIAICAYIIGMSIMHADLFNFIVGCIGWKLYEQHRIKE